MAGCHASPATGSDPYVRAWDKVRRVSFGARFIGALSSHACPDWHGDLRRQSRSRPRTALDRLTARSEQEFSKKRGRTSLLAFMGRQPEYPRWGCRADEVAASAADDELRNPAGLPYRWLVGNSGWKVHCRT
jgi:hypothetical protein